MFYYKKLNKYLSDSPKIVFVIFGWFTAFLIYTGTYAFRKPIGVVTFEGLTEWGVDYKILVLISQLVGYTISKLIGIKIVSEMQPNHRPLAIVTLIGIAGFALFMFAFVPRPFNIIFMVLNGLPLGMIWGIIFTYLEGRRTTELLAAGISATQIFSTGFLKSVGKWMIVELGIPEIWMPFATGMLFFPLLLFSVWLLSHMPSPTIEDVNLRTKREPMNREQRWKLFKHFSFGLVSLLLLYISLTVFRDFRDNFMADIWVSLGKGQDVTIFTRTETPIFVIMLFVVATMILIKNNILAFYINHVLLLVGSILNFVSTYLFSLGHISPELWMTLIGFGLYLGYVPYSIMLMDRLIATFKYVGTASFLVLLSDYIGYTGTTGLMLYKNFSNEKLSYLDWMVNLSYLWGILGVILTVFSLIYFRRKYKKMVLEENQVVPVSISLK